MKTIAERLKEARKRKGWNQEKLAEELNLQRGTISNWEQPDGDAPPPDSAVHAAEKLGQDAKEFLLLSLLREATITKTESNSILEKTVNDLFSQIQTPKPVHGGGPSSHLSLCDFPHGFQEPFAVIVGDKRENPPKNVGDLSAFSASTVDDRWIHKIGLPKTTEKISDKTFVMAPNDWLRKKAWQVHHYNRFFTCVQFVFSHLQ